ncbi:MAG: YdeI/OmpD-associated family protein [Arachnia sp.]
MPPHGPADEMVVADAAAWRSWLIVHEANSVGVWLVVAKKGTTSPTSLTYHEALEEALCGGWIDGQRRGRDETTFLQRFTPRRPRSLWSKRNVQIIQRLSASGRIRPRGHSEIDAAQRDGRWDRAYPGQAEAEIPSDLAAALQAAPGTAKRLEGLSAAQRYAALYPILTAADPASRERRIASLLARLLAKPA